MGEVQLKRPTGMYLMAVLFMLAPLGNLIVSFFGSEFSVIPSLANFLKFTQSVSDLDWLWLGLLFMTGALLLRARKATWTLAIVTLMLVLFVNLYRWGNGEFADGGLLVHGQLFMACLITGFVLLLLFYFRFPYMDRRAQWLFSAAARYEFRTPVSVVAQDIFDGVTESISTSGVRVRLQRDLEGSQGLRFVDVIFPDIRNIKVKGRVVEYRDNVLRLKFKELTKHDRLYLQEWLKSQIETATEKFS